MKPIIISVAEEKDGYIRLKKEDLEKYIEDAYQTGLRDGRASAVPLYPNGVRDIINTPFPVDLKPSKRNPMEITCKGGD